ncbi:MAG: hypothetical protein KKI01_00405, partial [Proteobacteria bacterium]|nr:hypothetical protein [Pseudomonadota bacterium]
LRGFIHATGIQDGAYQFVIDMSDAGGSVSKLIDVLRQHNARVLSILTSFDDASSGFKRVAVRILPEQGIDALASEIASMSGYNIVSQSLDDLSDLPKK